MFRPVVLNCFIEKQHLKMEETSMLKDVLQQGDWMCSVDLRMCIYWCQWYRNIDGIFVLCETTRHTSCISGRLEGSGGICIPTICLDRRVPTEDQDVVKGTGRTTPPTDGSRDTEVSCLEGIQQQHAAVGISEQASVLIFAGWSREVRTKLTSLAGNNGLAGVRGGVSIPFRVEFIPL